MWFNETIELGTETQTVTYGEPISTMTWREVYADKKSVLQKEIEMGNVLGFRPELKFEVYSFEYNGEKFARYKNVVYTITNSNSQGDKTWFNLSKVVE